MGDEGWMMEIGSSPTLIPYKRKRYEKNSHPSHGLVFFGV
jgi:hypothetical protein